RCGGESSPGPAGQQLWSTGQGYRPFRRSASNPGGRCVSTRAGQISEAGSTIRFCHVLEEPETHRQGGAESVDGVHEAAARAELRLARHLAGKACGAAKEVQPEQQEPAVGRYHGAVVVLHRRPLGVEDGLDLFSWIQVLGSVLAEPVTNGHAASPPSQAGHIQAMAPETTALVPYAY